MIIQIWIYQIGHKTKTKIYKKKTNTLKGLDYSKIDFIASILNQKYALLNKLVIFICIHFVIESFF